MREGGKSCTAAAPLEYPPAYIPRYRTFEIPERINAEGGVEKGLDEEAVRKVLLHLKQQEYEAIAICFLWSVSNPMHEVRVGEMIEEFLPGMPYTLSHRLLPIVREYAQRARYTCGTLFRRETNKLSVDLSLTFCWSND